MAHIASIQEDRTGNYNTVLSRGYMDGLFAGAVISLPPLLSFGSRELQAKVVPNVFRKEPICLAISEAFAGSDVGGMQTYAYKDGNEWVIS